MTQPKIRESERYNSSLSVQVRHREHNKTLVGSSVCVKPYITGFVIIIISTISLLSIQTFSVRRHMIYIH